MDTDTTDAHAHQYGPPRVYAVGQARETHALVLGPQRLALHHARNLATEVGMRLQHPDMTPNMNTDLLVTELDPERVYTITGEATRAGLRILEVSRP